MKKQPNTFQKYLRRAAAALCIICVVLDTPVHAFAESDGNSPDELIDEDRTENNGSTVTLYAQWGESTELPNTGGHGTRELEAGAVTGMGICLAAAIILRKRQNTVIRN